MGITLAVVVSVGLAIWLVLVVLFTPRIDYHLTARCAADDGTLERVLSALCQSSVHPGNRVAIMSSGAEFYPAMRDAILGARDSVNLEAYIFQPGEAADMLITAMVERARAGVEVRLVLDAIGSSTMRGEPLSRLEAAGCQVCFYQPLTWYRLHRLNNRTHRELLIVDGRVAFTGGAGVADWWLREEDGAPPWRDTMARVDGPLAMALQGVFAENWLECCGEILTSPCALAAPRAGRHHRRHGRQELAGGSRHRVACGVPDADGARHVVDRDQHALLPARPCVAADAARRGGPRGARLGGGAGPAHRPASCSLHEPPRCTGNCWPPASTSTIACPG